MLLQVNESLLQLYVDAESFRLHVDWLKAAKENVSLPFKAEEDANSQLLQLSGLITKSLHQVSPPQTKHQKKNLENFNSKQDKE